MRTSPFALKALISAIMLIVVVVPIYHLGIFLQELYTQMHEYEHRTSFIQGEVIGTTVETADDRIVLVLHYNYVHPTEGSAQSTDNVTAARYNEVNGALLAGDIFPVTVYYDPADKFNSSLSSEPRKHPVAVYSTSIILGLIMVLLAGLCLAGVKLLRRYPRVVTSAIS